MNPLFRTGFSISDSLKSVRKTVLIYETIIKKHINRIKKLYEERKDDFKYLVENPDGSVCAKIPLKWIKINEGSKEGRIMTEEQKEAARITLQKARENNNKNK